ncbi:acyl-CoA dehydrogenase family protein, partial [Erythrobacter donghaensis]
MDMDFTPDELAFQVEVRSFLASHLNARLIEGAKRTPGVFVEPDIGLEWQRILHEKGWLAIHWPEEDGGTGWTPVQRYIFEKECALAGAPALAVLGLKLVGPV